MDSDGRGLFDPGDDGAGELDLIRYLDDAGVPPDRMVGVSGERALREVLAEYRLLGDGPRSTARETAAELGADIEVVERIWAAAGLPVPDRDAPTLTAAETQVVSAFFDGAELFGDEALLRFTRVLAGSIARISEAAVSMFGVNIEDPLVSGGGSQVDLTRAVDEALIALGVIPELFNSLFRRHALEAIRRLGAAHAELSSHDQVQMTVGFADLVDSTTWIQQQGPRELAAALGRFDQLAHSSLRGAARLVKTIGDEVMFVALNAGDGCRTALTLVAAAAAEPGLPDLRVGLAAGSIAAHDGDYYGIEVNRAARLVSVGAPGAVLASAAIAENAAAEPDLRFESVGTRRLAGFAEPVEALSVSWA